MLNAAKRNSLDEKKLCYKMQSEVHLEVIYFVLFVSCVTDVLLEQGIILIS